MTIHLRIIAIIFLASLSNGVLAQTKSYTGANGTYEITYPTLWEQGMARGNQFSLLAPKVSKNKALQAPSLNISVIPLSAGYENTNLHELATLEEKMTKDQNYGSSKVTYLPSKFQEINGREWWLFEYIIEQNGFTTHAQVYKTIAEQKTFAVTYMGDEEAYPVHLESARSILNSFRFLKEAQTGPASSQQIEKQKEVKKPSPALNRSSPAEASSEKQAIVFAASKAGSISPDAVTVVASSGRDFYGGFAIVQSSKYKYSFINRQGKVVIPYGKYKFDSNDNFYNNYLRAENEERKQGFLDTSGKEAMPFIYRHVREITEDGYAKAQIYSETLEGGIKYASAKDYFISPSEKKSILYQTWPKTKVGKSVSTVNSPTYPYGEISDNTFRTMMSEGLMRVSNKSGKGGMAGYINRQGTLLIKGPFHQAKPFVNGYAKVAQFDEQSGKTKWGFIDKKGTLVIPYKFTNEPGDFSEGLAAVVPADNTEYDIAYINTKGEVVYKFKTTAPNYRYEGLGGTKPVYSPTVNYALDKQAYLFITRKQAEPYRSDELLLLKDGSFLNVNEVVKTNFPQELGRFIFFAKHQVIFPNVVTKKDGTHSTFYGVSGLDGKLVISPVFLELHPQDPVSGLSRAVAEKDGKRINGYVDGQGVFVLIIDPTEKW
jgi:hypothetical protein